jgi:hypothetical protein
MKDALTPEVKQKAVDEIVQVLKNNNLPTTANIRDAVIALLKEVSCAHQNGN